MTGNFEEKKTATCSPYKGKDAYIFISYAHKNSAAVLPIIDAMQKHQYRVWYDEGIDPGTEWDENIASHVENCYCFIAFLSKEYLESSNCKDELTFARELDKPRLLVYLEDVVLPSGMRMRLNRLQAIHMYKYENIQDFYHKLFEFSAMQNCKEELPVPTNPFQQASRELTIKNYRKKYHGVLVGQGSAGSVYKAYDEERKEDVVFKTYPIINSLRIPLFTRCDLQDDMMKLNSEHLCKVIDVVTGNVFAIVMEYVEGQTLGEYLRGKKLTLAESLEIVTDILSGLCVLHENSIFYGDVTPNNVMIADGKAILCDYSESNYNGSRCDNLTALIWKYRSPERNPGELVDFRSDIYEVGMILDTLTLNMVSEQQAFELYFHKKPLVLNRPKELTFLEEQIFGIIEKATKADAGERYDSAQTMLKEIEHLIELTW